MDFVLLEDLLLPAPIATLVSVLIVCGWWRLSHIFSARIWLEPTLIRVSGVFFVFVGLFAAVVNLLATVQFIPQGLIRVAAVFLCGFGIVQTWICKGAVQKKIRNSLR